MDIMDTYGVYALLGSLVILYVVPAAVAIWEWRNIRRNRRNDKNRGAGSDN